MARYQIILAYDGTQFAGFQRQARRTEVRTVQGVLEAALASLGWRDRSILAAGRTDTGVHATGQVVAFDLDWRHSHDELQAALNSNLPADVVVRAIKESKPNFHPRYDAYARRYQYAIYCEELRDPLSERYAWRVWPPARLADLKICSSYLLGEHDFMAFGSPPKPGGPTIRIVYEADWQESNRRLLFEIEANGFLYHMVRRLVAAQVAVALGKMSFDDFMTLLSGLRTQKIRSLAPPQGLVLEKVIYDEIDFGKVAEVARKPVSGEMTRG